MLELASTTDVRGRAWRATTSSRRCSCSTTSTRWPWRIGCARRSTRSAPTSAPTAATSRCSAVDADAGVVRLRLLGSCDGCSSSSVTLELAVQQAIEEAAPEITRIDVADSTTAPAPAAATPVSLGRKPQPAPAMAPIYGLRALAPGRVGPLEIEGNKLIVCRVGTQLYAYRSACPLCDSALDTASVDGPVLRCPMCNAAYDMRAGRPQPGREHHPPRPPPARRGRRRGAHRSAGVVVSETMPLAILQRIRQGARPAPTRRAVRHVRRAGPRRARARGERREPQPDVHVPRLLAAVHDRRRRRWQVPRRARPLRRARRLRDRPRAVGRAPDPGERGVLLPQLVARRRWPRSTRAPRARPSRCSRSTRGSGSSPPTRCSRTMAPDVEALLVRRDAEHARGIRRAHRRLLRARRPAAPAVAGLRRRHRGARRRSTGSSTGSERARRVSELAIAVLSSAARAVRGGADAAAAPRGHRGPSGEPVHAIVLRGPDPHRAPAPALLARGGGPAARAVRRAAAVGRVAAAVPLDARVDDASPGSPARTEVDLPVPCTYDFEVAAAKYLHSPRRRRDPAGAALQRHVFATATAGSSVQPVPWHVEAEHRLPVAGVARRRWTRTSRTAAGSGSGGRRSTRSPATRPSGRCRRGRTRSSCCSRRREA